MCENFVVVVWCDSETMMMMMMTAESKLLNKRLQENY